VCAASPAEKARRWLEFALADLQLAELAPSSTGVAPQIRCYHAQQCAEKAIKASLIPLQIRSPFRHDLDELRDLIPSGWDVVTAHPDLAALTQWAVEARYPGNWPNPTDADARDAARQARVVWETILHDFERHGFDVAAFRYGEGAGVNESELEAHDGPFVGGEGEVAGDGPSRQWGKATCTRARQDGFQLLRIASRIDSYDLPCRRASSIAGANTRW
jgi:HEPN domain-containing protein